MEPKVVVCMPAHNEAKHLRNVVDGISQYVKTIVVVDDGSYDSSLRILAQLKRKYKIHVIKHEFRLGKGAALRTACDYAIETLKADIIVCIDSDGQHKPSDLPMMIEKVKHGRDIVFTYRHFTKEMPLRFRIGNTGLNFVTWLFFGIWIKDTQSGFRAFTNQAYGKIRWQANDYSMESEMITSVKKEGLKYCEVPIDTIYLDRKKGTTIKDGVKIFKKLFNWWWDYGYSNPLDGALPLAIIIGLICSFYGHMLIALLSVMFALVYLQKHKYYHG